jgi:hypothetical protein
MTSSSAKPQARARRVKYQKSRVPQGRVSSVVILHLGPCAACGILQVPIDLPSPLFALIAFSQTRSSQELQVKGLSQAKRLVYSIRTSNSVACNIPSVRERFQTRCSSSREVSPIRLLLESAPPFANAFGCILVQMFSVCHSYVP